MTTAYERLCNIPLDRPMEYRVMEDFLRALSVEYDLPLHVIGTTTRGRPIFAVRVGAAETISNETVQTALYVGGMEEADWVSCALLLRFLRDYCVFHKEGRRLYGVNLPYLWENRVIYVIPCLCPDMCFENVRTGKNVQNAPSALPTGFLPIQESFLAGMPFDCTENASVPPECTAFCQFCHFTPTRLCLYLTSSLEKAGFYTVPYCASRAMTIGKLLARMASWELTHQSMENSPAAWYTTEQERPAFRVDLGKDRSESGYYYGYAALREVFFSAPLLL